MEDCHIVGIPLANIDRQAPEWWAMDANITVDDAMFKGNCYWKGVNNVFFMATSPVDQHGNVPTIGHMPIVQQFMDDGASVYTHAEFMALENKDFENVNDWPTL